MSLGHHRDGTIGVWNRNVAELQVFTKHGFSGCAVPVGLAWCNVWCASDKGQLQQSSLLQDQLKNLLYCSRQVSPVGSKSIRDLTEGKAALLVFVEQFHHRCSIYSEWSAAWGRCVLWKCPNVKSPARFAWIGGPTEQTLDGWSPSRSLKRNKTKHTPDTIQPWKQNIFLVNINLKMEGRM